MEEALLQKTITEVLEGQLEKFEAILLAYQKPIVLYCYHMLGSYPEAEDSAQEVFLKAYRSLERYNPGMPFGAWLYKIAYNQCIDLIRRRKLVKVLALFYQDEKEHRPVEQSIEEAYPDEKVQRAMALLTAEERNLLILRCIEEMSYQDISLILHQNSTRLRKKFERAARKFRRHYTHAKGEDHYAALHKQGVTRNPS